MTNEDIVAHCLTYPTAFVDYPFGEDTPVLRHKSNRKVFALLMERNAKQCINLKCEPMKADFLRGLYEGVTPGYHMNKTHWNTVDMNADVGEFELYDMIADSFALTAPKSGRRKKGIK